MWRWEPDLGTIDRRFESQAEAETWLTDHYEQLHDDGVGVVTLWEEGRLVYGPMSLAPG